MSMNILTELVEYLEQCSESLSDRLTKPDCIDREIQRARLAEVNTILQRLVIIQVLNENAV